MDATELKALLNKKAVNGDMWKNVIYISLNNGKVLYVTEDMKKNNEIDIEDEFIKIVNHNFMASAMVDYKNRDVIEYHAIEFVECVMFAVDNEGLITTGQTLEGRNYDVADNIIQRSNAQSLRVTHPNVEVLSGATLTKEYEITATSAQFSIKLSGENKQLGVAEMPHNMYTLPFNPSVMTVTNNSPEFTFEVKVAGEHEILVHIGDQELYFKVIAEQAVESTEQARVMTLSNDEMVTTEDENIVTQGTTVITIEGVADSAKSRVLGMNESLVVTVNPDQELIIASSSPSVVEVNGNILTKLTESGQSTVTITAEDGTVRQIVIKS